MTKSPDAFRTISEVADWLDVQAHVLRFWESKFTQIKPIKRAGGRRYYRPADMLLIGGIKKVLYDDGMTIKGAQKLLREKGVAFVSDQSQPLDDLTMAVMESNEADAAANNSVSDVEDKEADWFNAEQPPSASPPEEIAEPEAEAGPEAGAVANEDFPDQIETVPEAFAEKSEEPASLPILQAEAPAFSEGARVEEGPVAEEPPEVEDFSDTPEPEVSELDRVLDEAPAEPEDAATAPPDATDEADEMVPLPSFRARRRSLEGTPSPAPEEERTGSAEMAEPEFSATAEEPQAYQAPTDAPPLSTSENVITDQDPETPEPAPQEDPKPLAVDVPAVPPFSDISVNPSTLSAMLSVKKISPPVAREIKPLVARLNRLRASMANARVELDKD